MYETGDYSIFVLCGALLLPRPFALWRLCNEMNVNSDVDDLVIAQNAAT